MPQSKNDVRNTQIQVRLSEKEKALIEKYAKRYNLKVSEYVRKTLLNPERQPTNETTN